MEDDSKCEARLIGTIKGLGDVYQADGSLAEQYSAFKEVGIQRIAYPDEIAQIRIAGLTGESSRTNIGVLSYPGRADILLRNLTDYSLALKLVEAHLNSRDLQESIPFYCVLDELANRQKNLQPEKRDLFTVPSRRPILLDSSNPLSRFLFRDQTTPYFNRQGEINFHSAVIKSPKEAHPVLNCLSIDPASYGSCIICKDTHSKVPALAILKR